MAQPKGILKTRIARQVEEGQVGAKFTVRRPIGDRDRKDLMPGDDSRCDPFIMLDHLGPLVFGPGEAIGAPDHPHKGFEAINYVISGESEHLDSKGNQGISRDGCVQWMTAGSGVVHSEMPTDEFLKNGGLLEGVQLWVNVPKEKKRVEPKYEKISPDMIPVVEDGKTKVKVIAGESMKTKAPIGTIDRSSMMYLDIHVSQGGEFVQEIPEDYDGFAYVWKGEGKFGEDCTSCKKKLEMGQGGAGMSEDDCTCCKVSLGWVAFLEKRNSLKIRAKSDQDIHVLLIAAVPINEPIAQGGGFVLNTEDEIKQARVDYEEDKFGRIKVGSREERRANNKAAFAKWKHSQANTSCQTTQDTQQQQ